MNYFLILLILLSFSLSCGKFENSPYGADAYNTEYNLAAVRYLSTFQTSSSTYKVALISDTHNYYDELEKLVKKINRGGYTVVIHAGDITNFGLNSEYQASIKIFKKLKVPMMTTARNQDFLSHGEIIYRKIFGSPTYSFEFQGTHYIFANNNGWESSEGGYAQDWLENELKESTASQIIITTHVPPFDSDRYSDEDIHRWKDIIAPYNIPYYISGHNHNHVVKDFG